MEKDIFDRGFTYSKVEIDQTFPKYIIENKEKLKEVMPQEVFRNYIRNREMIDLNRTPEAIKKESIDQYENYKYPQRSNILTYLIENRMKMLIENAGEF